MYEVTEYPAGCSRPLFHRFKSPDEAARYVNTIFSDVSWDRIDTTEADWMTTHRLYKHDQRGPVYKITVEAQP